MTVQTELAQFYQKCGFGEELGSRPPRTVLVFTGCLLVPMPNIETRRKYLLYHDLHHLVTGYSVGRIGEGKMSAWELGTGTFYRYPILGVMNLIALSTGLVLDRHGMWEAFNRGCDSENLYPAANRAKVDTGEWQSIAAIRDDILETHQRHVPKWCRKIEFACYSIIALAIHAVVAIPAVILRIKADMTGCDSWVKAFKPKPRNDLY